MCNDLFSLLRDLFLYRLIGLRDRDLQQSSIITTTKTRNGRCSY